MKHEATTATEERVEFTTHRVWSRTCRGLMGDFSIREMFVTERRSPRRVLFYGENRLTEEYRYLSVGLT